MQGMKVKSNIITITVYQPQSQLSGKVMLFACRRGYYRLPTTEPGCLARTLGHVNCYIHSNVMYTR